MFVDHHTLANMQRQGRAVHEFLQLRKAYCDDIHRVMNDAGVSVPTNLKRRTLKFAPRDIAHKMQVLSRLDAKQKKSTKHRDARGHKQRKRKRGWGMSMDVSTCKDSIEPPFVGTACLFPCQLTAEYDGEYFPKKEDWSEKGTKHSVKRQVPYQSACTMCDA